MSLCRSDSEMIRPGLISNWPVGGRSPCRGVGRRRGGLYFLNAADFTDAAQFCDALGRASPPESCPLSFAAGDYILMVVSFGPLYAENDPDPPFIELNIN